MARVLICFEMPALTDIAARARALAEVLQARGHRVDLVVPDTNAACRELHGGGLAFYQAPLPAMNLPAARARNFGDGLAALGFLDAAFLRRRRDDWRQLFSLLRPDVLVVDHAPAAQLVARLDRIVCVRLADGFDTPPAAAPLPVLQPWIAQDPGLQQSQEAVMLHNVNLLLQEAGEPPLVQLHQLYAEEHVWFATWAAFDPFGPRPNARYVGWLRTPVQSAATDWPSGARRRIAVHLRASELAAPALRALTSARTAVVAVLPGCSRENIAEHAAGAWRCSSSSREGLPYLHGADLVVFDGDAAVLAACVQCGVPVICVPSQVEGFYLAGSLVRERLGLAMGTVAGNFHGRLRGAVRAMLASPKYRRRVRQFARECARSGPADTVDLSDPLAAVASEIETLAGIAPAPRAST